NEANAAQKLGVAEGEARKTRGIAETHARNQQSQQQRDDAFQRLLRGDDDGARETEQHEPEIFERAELERELGERRRGENQHRGAEQSANGREDETGAERSLRLPLAR